MDPNVGAQYLWSALFAQSSQAFWGLIQGWVTVFAWIASVSSGIVGTAYIAQGIISFWWAEYNSQLWHLTLIMWTVGLVTLFCNLSLRRIFNTHETLRGSCHTIFHVAFIIILTTLSEKSSAYFVFSTLTYEVSGWNNPGVCFSIGLLSSIFLLTASDGVLHMSRCPQSCISVQPLLV